MFFHHYYFHENLQKESKFMKKKLFSLAIIIWIEMIIGGL